MSYDKQKVILGLLKISVDGTALGYSRGGSSFTVNRVIHHIAADGDLGDTTNAHILDEERPTLVVNQLVVDPAIFLKLFPAAANSSGTLSPTGHIASADYHDVVAVAKTKEGKFVRITLNDAINKGNKSIPVSSSPLQQAPSQMSPQSFLSGVLLPIILFASAYSF